ncbi:MAG: hypothetical protein ABI579_04405 [Candidatus Sumerlaeota bacterium]
MNERERFEELVGDYAEGALSPADASSWDALLVSHPAWRGEAEQERALVSMLRSAGKLKAPATLKAEVLNAVTRQTPVIVVAKRNTRTIWQITAVAAILIAGVFVYTNNEPAPVIAGKNRSAIERRAIVANAEKPTSDFDSAGAMSAANESKLKRDANATSAPSAAGGILREEGADKVVNNFEPPAGAANAAQDAEVQLYDRPADKPAASNSLGLEVEASKESQVALDSVASALQPLTAPASAPSAPSKFDGGRSPSFGNAIPKENDSAEISSADDNLQKAARQAGEPAMALPTREQVRSAVIAKTGKVLLDTPWYETAVDYQDKNGMVPTPATAENARYIVAQVPTMEDAKALPGASVPQLQKQASDEFKKQEITSPQSAKDVRVIIPYSASRNDDILQQDEAADKKETVVAGNARKASEKTDSSMALESASRLSTTTGAPADNTTRAMSVDGFATNTKDATAGSLHASGGTVAQEPAQEPAAGPRDRALRIRPAATETFFKSFDDFDSWMRVNNAQFIMYTPDRSVAFSAEGSAKTPVPIADAKSHNEFTGYLVYHYKNAKQADAMLGKLPGLTGEGVRNVGLVDAELVAQPDGVRLVIPYHMDVPTP